MSVADASVIESVKNSLFNNDKKYSSIDDVYKACEKCENCKLKNELEVNKKIVKSSGRLNAPIMIIGKNPSINRRGDSCFGSDDNVNNPHLELMLKRHKFSMNDVYSTNYVKCSTANNEDPDRQCIDACKEYLDYEIELINPSIILYCGKLVSNENGLKFGEYKIINNKIYLSINHPSSLAYNNSEENKQKYYKQLDIISEELKKIRNKMFVQLHFHDEYSIRDALGKIEDYKNLIKERHLPAFCTTNHGNIGGFIRQYLECNKIGIKPIFGCELYINNKRQENKEDLTKDDRKNNHLCVYAKNIEGFNNLSKITSDAWINGFYYKPRTDMQFIKQYSKGLIASSACMAGELSQALENNNERLATKLIEQYKKIFECFYIELILIDLQDQKIMNSKLAKIAKETNTKTIVTVDTHYMLKEYSKIHNIMLLIRDGNTLADLNDSTKRDKVYQYKVKDLFYKNIDDIYETFKNGHESEYFTEELLQQSIDNVFDFINNIESFKLDTTPKLPKLSDNSEQLFKQKIEEGFIYRGFDKIKNKNYYDQMLYEFDVITQMNYTDYFLIMQDIIVWAKNCGIYVGPGRGSVAGSLIAYLMRITEIDPIKYDLVFERFISLGRTDSFVDIDTDFDPNYRDQVKEYIVNRFGREKVCSVGTYGTYKSRGTLLDVARVYNVPVYETIQLTKNVMTSDADQMSFEEISSTFPAVKNYFDKYPEIKPVCDVVRGQIRNISKHAAGMIISDRDLSQNIPLMQTEGNIFSAWQEGSDFHELSHLGFVKFDILGLNNLAVIKDCIELIKQRHGINLNYYNWIDMNNKKALECANEADTFGVFQFESRISRQLLKNIGVDCFMDLSHISAILRPGPLRAGIPDTFANRKNGKEQFEIPEILKDILKPTYGVMIYQEQIMKIAERIGGFTLIESNDFRKALVKYGKSNSAESGRVAKAFSYKDKFISNASKYISAGQAEDLFEKMLSFISYGFNKGHSLSYAYTSYIQFYLKANYFIEFMVALLNNTDRAKETNQKDSVLKNYINYAKEKGINIINPDINLSQEKFSILDDKTIIFGFSHIKNLSSGSDVIIKHQPYKNFEDFCTKITGKKIEEEQDLKQNFLKQKKQTIEKKGDFEKIKINKSKVESLVWAGCFDKYNYKKRCELIKLYNTKVNKKKDYAHEELTRRQIIEKEIDVLNICLSDTILPDYVVDFLNKNKTFITPSQALKNDVSQCNIVGQLDKIIACKTKSGTNVGSKYYKLTIIDNSDQINITCFGDDNVKYVNDNLKQGMFVIIKDIELNRQFELWGTKNFKNNVKILTI